MSEIISVVTIFPNLIHDLRKILPHLTFHQVEHPETDHNLRQSQIIVGDYHLFGPYIYNLPNAKWIQGTWAGVEKLFQHLKPGKEPKILITRYGDRIGSHMAEYVLANIIINERIMFDVRDNQKNKIWTRKGTVSGYRIISELNIGVMGLGGIGNRVAKTLNTLGATVIGFGRRSSIDLSESIHISQYYSKENLIGFLKQCDYIVNVLPSTNETVGLLNGDALENCKERCATFINIGRGNIISEVNLVNALEKEWISGAILDVFESEPLPPDSRLWTMPNVFITPHVSGVVRSIDVAECFKENLQLFNDGKPLPATIDFMKGY